MIDPDGFEYSVLASAAVWALVANALDQLPVDEEAPAGEDEPWMLVWQALESGPY